MEEKMVALGEFCDNLSRTNEQLTNLLVEQKEAFGVSLFQCFVSLSSSRKK